MISENDVTLIQFNVAPGVTSASIPTETIHHVIRTTLTEIATAFDEMQSGTSINRIVVEYNTPTIQQKTYLLTLREIEMFEIGHLKYNTAITDVVLSDTLCKFNIIININITLTIPVSHPNFDSTNPQHVCAVIHCNSKHPTKFLTYHVNNVFSNISTFLSHDFGITQVMSLVDAFTLLYNATNL